MIASQSDPDTDQPHVTIAEASGRSREIFRLPAAVSDRPSVLAFAMPKSGSTLLDSILLEIAPQVGLVHVSIMGAMFAAGLPDEDIPETVADVFLETGYCYSGFRNLPPAMRIPILPGAAKILLMRDPRDMLVSHYHSVLSSHPLPEDDPAARSPLLKLRSMAQKLEIDSYVLELAPLHLSYLRIYADLCSRHDVRIFRYEDIIFCKRAWIDDICAVYGWDVPREIIDMIAARHDHRPDTENPAHHIRQVVPGDHARKLRADTIERLDRQFSESMRHFGYRIG